jgi:hypothetical protein
MCGRYFRRSDKQRIAEAFHLGIFEDLPLELASSYNIALPLCSRSFAITATLENARW